MIIFGLIASIVFKKFKRNCLFNIIYLKIKWHTSISLVFNRDYTIYKSSKKIRKD
jgi:hypothetical protein